MPHATPPPELREYLDPDEEVLWVGAPRRGIRFHAYDLFMVPFSLMWGGLVITMAVVGLQQGPNAGLLVLVPFLAVGLYLIAGRFLVDAWLRGRTVYAVTNRRALVLSGAWSRTLRAVPHGGAYSLRRGRDGSGSITFGTTAFPWAFEGLPWPGMEAMLPTAFHALEDVGAAERALAEATRRAAG